MARNSLGREIPDTFAGKKLVPYTDPWSLKPHAERSTRQIRRIAQTYLRDPVDVAIEATDRQGLLRDISDVFTREKTNVIGVQTQSVKGSAWMVFTVEVPDTERLNKVLAIVAAVPGVRTARRR